MEDKLINTCDFCQLEINGQEYYNIYNLEIKTDLQTHYIGMQALLEDLADYAMDKSYHMSSAQIMILRPDIVTDFLIAKKIKENILDIKFKDYKVCYACFDDYKGLVPLI